MIIVAGTTRDVRRRESDSESDSESDGGGGVADEDEDEEISGDENNAFPGLQVVKAHTFDMDDDDEEGGAKGEDHNNNNQINIIQEDLHAPLMASVVTITEATINNI